MNRGMGCIMTGIFLLVGLMVLGLVGFSIYAATHDKTVAGCQVIDKDRTRTDDGSDARIYTENCGTFKVGDSLLNGTFSSADTYAGIKVDKTYDFETVGFRIPFFSSFPNILKAEEVTS